MDYNQEERLLDATELTEDSESENPLRPQNLTEYIGQKEK